MTIPALWTKHRPIALGIAHEYHIPGMGHDDVEQESMVALWEACREYDKTKGRFPAFARVVIHRHLTDLLRAATADKRTAVLAYDVDVPAPDQREGREQLSLLVDALSTLTPRERKAVHDHTAGVPTTSSKAHDMALFRARAKLRQRTA